MEENPKWQETGRQEKIKQLDISETLAVRIDNVELYNSESKLYYLVIQTLLGNPKKDEWSPQGKGQILKESKQKIIVS
ncbi:MULTISPECIES: hypothetical protein [Lactobacillaceae]|uniref:hypothetical protein n=1 Tax=Lactobacillaceae TaxID=33958 RepID=UPI0010F47C2B|nr:MULTISPECIES: hypothetical protein [Lactiplantibacillus]MCM8651496.1 hypothetical protein [Lactiplantibacillus sp. E932]MCT1241792.1 hypothetical protein [Lactiplantibacillus plantarum]MDO7548838.1 hypothetical protein [Lactiplantibacillus plantarum]